MWEFFEELAKLTLEQRELALRRSEIILNHSTFVSMVMNLPKPERLAAFRVEVEKLQNQA